MTNEERLEKKKEGWNQYCTERYKEIPGYEEALAHGFIGYVLHHVKEIAFSAKTLKDYGMYYNVPPEDLIWIREDEHRKDVAISCHNPEKSQYHQFRLEYFGKRLAEYKERHSEKAKKTWSRNEKYIKCEGKHQLESDEQRRAYQAEYHREWYYKNKERQLQFNRNYRKNKKECAT